MHWRNLLTRLAISQGLVNNARNKSLHSSLRLSFCTTSSNNNDNDQKITVNADDELTLAILKPDLVANPTDLDAVKSLIIQSNFRVLRQRRLRLSAADARRFYAEHDGKFFFNRLVTYMTSGEIEACVLCKPDAIADWRRLMGPTKVLKAIYERPDSIRGRYGLTDTRNATHGSDSVDNAVKEIAFFFPDFSFTRNSK